MLRFTIRDLLWLMVVVGVGCVIVHQRAKISTLEATIDHQDTRLLWADINIMTLVEGWQKDRPDRIKIEDDYINIMEDGWMREAFGRPLRPK